MNSKKKSRRWIWFLVLGILLTLYGIVDELFLGFIREGCIIGNLHDCAQAPTITIRAHSCVLGGFALFVASCIIGIRRLFA